MSASFTYKPSTYVPFRDEDALRRCRKLSRADIERHPNPDFRIQVLPGDEIEYLWIADMVERIRQSDIEDKAVVLIVPNPCPGIYRKVARFVNRMRINCRNVHLFAMDEYANEEGVIAPESWELGFMHSLLKCFYYEVNEELRPARVQVVGPTNKNLASYGEKIAEHGGADMCYSGPGWTGHVAFIEPDAPEFDMPIDEWKKLGPRICTLSPFTLAQNSLHGSFGMSGDIAAVPPKAATIGPAEVITAKNRIEMAGITVHGTTTAWQRLIARLCYHGPVTPKLPSSIHQELRTDCYISELIAQDIALDWNKGY